MQSILLFISSTLFGFFCFRIAKTKNRNPFFWFNMGVFFGLIGLIIIFFLKTKKIITPQKIFFPTEIITDTNFWYYIDETKKQIGPMSLKALFDKYKFGNISETTYVWNDTLKDWKELKEISFFSKYLKDITNWL